MEIAVIIAISLLFFKPSEVLIFLGKFIHFIENLKSQLEDIKNDAFTQTLKEEENLKDVTFVEIRENYDTPDTRESSETEHL